MAEWDTDRHGKQFLQVSDELAYRLLPVDGGVVVMKVEEGSVFVETPVATRPSAYEAKQFVDRITEGEL